MNKEKMELEEAICKIDIDSNNIVCGQYEGTSDFIPKKKIEEKIRNIEKSQQEKGYLTIVESHTLNQLKELLEYK